MPANITVVDGVYSAVLGGEDIGAGVIAQRLKLLWGADGSAFVISAASPLPVVQTGAFVVTTLPPLPAGSNVIGAVTQSGPWVITTLPAIPAGTNNIGDVDVLTLPALPTGANVIGAVTQSGTWSVRLQDGAGTAITNTAGALDVNVKTSAVGSTVGTENGTIASGHTNVAEVMAMPYTFTGDAGHTRAGAIPWYTLDLDESHEQVKATAGVVWGWHWQNRHATLERYLKWYNHAAPTIGTTPPAFTLGMKPNSEANVWCAVPGVGFTTAISVAATTGFADNDTGAPGANEVLLTVFRK